MDTVKLQSDIKEKLDEHLQSLCTEFQQKMGITSGDIDPFDAFELDLLMDDMTRRLAIILLKQPRKECV